MRTPKHNVHDTSRKVFAGVYTAPCLAASEFRLRVNSIYSLTVLQYSLALHAKCRCYDAYAQTINQANF